MKKLPLQNTETKGIPLGLQVNRAIARELQHPPESVGGGQKLSPDQDHNCCPLEVPTKFTLCKIKKAIQETKRKQPDLERMVESKLASPNTAKYIRKKVSSFSSFILWSDRWRLDVRETYKLSGVSGPNVFTVSKGLLGSQILVRSKWFDSHSDMVLELAGAPEKTRTNIATPGWEPNRLNHIYSFVVTHKS